MSDETANALELSDEEFMNQDPSIFIEDTADSENTEDKVNPSDSTESDTETASDEDSEAQEQTDSTEDSDEVTQPDGDTQTEDETTEIAEKTESSKTSKAKSPDTEGDTQETKDFDYESAYKKVTAPFKANGTEMQVDNPDDAIKLMQMGANYHKKMAQLKPHLKIVSMLEKNQLLEESKINNLIDISKKDPKALAKLIKESGMDPDIDFDEPEDYTPKDYSVSDKEFNLDQVLAEIQDSPTFDKTIKVLTKEWDDRSKTTISENPEIIAIIDGHMNNGVFDKVNAVLQREKTLGNLQGISMVDAYKHVADTMLEQGLLSAQEPAKPASEKTDTKSNADVKRNEQRRAAAPVKQTVTKKPKEEPEFLGLSDDEFMKKYAST